MKDEKEEDKEEDEKEEDEEEDEKEDYEKKVCGAGENFSRVWWVDGWCWVEV